MIKHSIIFFKLQNTFTRITKDIPVTSMKTSKYMSHLPKSHGQPIKDFKQSVSLVSDARLVKKLHQD